MMRQASENSSVWQSYIVNKQVRAAEAMQRSRKCKTAEARNALIDLARTWTQGSVAEREHRGRQR
jgi:hypothetical protein